MLLRLILKDLTLTYYNSILKALMDDLITVITPTFNCEKYIEQCIKSVINQKNVKTAHIVIDGSHG